MFDRAQSFTYDGRNQLTEVTTTDNGGTGVVQSYAYDANGNRKPSGITDPLDRNRLLEDLTHTYVYDGEGNLLERIDKMNGDKDVSTWDFRNRLTSAYGKKAHS